MTNPLLQYARDLRRFYFETEAAWIAKDKLLPLMRALNEAERLSGSESAQSKPAVEEWMCEAEAALRLGVSVSTLYRRRKAGTLKPDLHYCWRLGRIFYGTTHLRRIQGIEAAPAINLRKAS